MSVYVCLFMLEKDLLEKRKEKIKIKKKVRKKILCSNECYISEFN